MYLQTALQSALRPLPTRICLGPSDSCDPASYTFRAGNRMRVSLLLQSSHALARVSSMRAFTHDLLLHLWPLHCIWDGVAWRRVQFTNFFQYPIKHLMILMACARALCASAWLRYLDKGRSGVAGNSRHKVCNGPPNFAALIAGATSNTIKIWMQWIIMGKDYELSVSRRWSEDNADHEGFRFLYVHGGEETLGRTCKTKTSSNKCRDLLERSLLPLWQAVFKVERMPLRGRISGLKGPGICRAKHYMRPNSKR